MCGEGPETKKTVYRIWDKKSEKYAGSYSRSCHDEFDFDSEESALNANCHGMFKDSETYEIHKCIRKYEKQ